jgi:hypothetical protein
MISNKKFENVSVVITSINKPNVIIKKYHTMCKKIGANFFLIGDKKTPNYSNKFSLISFENQKKLDFEILKKLPFNSYARKNIGYLLAMKVNSKIIIETDDDNYPKKNFFNNINLKKKLIELSGPAWINILKYFIKNKKLIWPRGWPLNLIIDNKRIIRKMKLKISPVQQRMCDGNPDVDAIFRLTNNNIDYKFKKKNYFLGLKSLCPFNSQNTVWHKLAFPMMYLPSYCSMRATDIWRGFVALRLLNNYKWNLSFLEPTVIQIRNAHNLMHDFSQELEVYKNTIKFNKILKKTNLSKHHKDLLKNLFKCYEALVKEKIINKNELILLRYWIKDINNIFPNYYNV